MKRPAKSFKAVFAAVFFLAIVGIAGRASGAQKPQFVYATNTGARGVGMLYGYAIDATTGALSPVPGSPVASGLNPYRVAVTPSNKFVYVLNNGSEDISAYTVNAATGALTPVSGSPFATGSNPLSLAIDPSGKFVYVANSDSFNISAYTIDGTTGALSPVPGSPFQPTVFPGPRFTQWPWSVATDPSGKFLYLVIEDSNLSGYVSAYKIDSNTGALTPPDLASLLPTSGFTPVEVDPSGKFVYVVDSGSSGTFPSSISAYKPDATTGALTELSGSPFAAGTDAFSMVFDPLGKFAYVPNRISGNILGYTVNNTTGALAPVAGLPFPLVDGDPFSIAADPSGKFVYASEGTFKEDCNFGCDIAAYTIDRTNGSLALIPGSPFAFGGAGILATTHSSTAPFKSFKARAWIDEYSRTSFYVEGFFRLGDGSEGIDLEKDNLEFQLGSLSVTLPAGSFKRHRHGYEFDGRIDGVDLDFEILQSEGQYFFGVEGSATVSTWFQNPVTVGLTIGDNEGSTKVVADIDK